MTIEHVGQQVLNQPPALQDFNRLAGNRALRDALARDGAGWARFGCGLDAFD
ncbi:MAG TPA: hypothetical protein PL143_03615, partial [Rhodocyclaceae bacterium]|nr:hypothetical protein [Rhodocyclaceae bacterium]